MVLIPPDNLNCKCTCRRVQEDILVYEKEIRELREGSKVRQFSFA